MPLRRKLGIVPSAISAQLLTGSDGGLLALKRSNHLYRVAETYNHCAFDVVEHELHSILIRHFDTILLSNRSSTMHRQQGSQKTSTIYGRFEKAPFTQATLGARVGCLRPLELRR
jgi:hypothetical protein